MRPPSPFRDGYVEGDLAADFDGDGTLGLHDLIQIRDAYVIGCL